LHPIVFNCIWISVRCTRCARGTIFRTAGGAVFEKWGVWECGTLGGGRGL